MRRLLYGLAWLPLWAALPAQALDYRSVAQAAVMYDAPSSKASPLFVIAPLTPVEVVVTVQDWVKVRDASGGLAWIEQRAVADQRTVLVTAARAQVLSQPDVAAPLVFEADKSVVLELLQAAPPGWAQVKHRDGQIGYVRASQVWGL
jgi:SH3-like domain-containing protein